MAAPTTTWQCGSHKQWTARRNIQNLIGKAYDATHRKQGVRRKAFQVVRRIGRWETFEQKLQGCRGKFEDVQLNTQNVFGKPH